MGKRSKVGMAPTKKDKKGGMSAIVEDVAKKS